MTDSSDPRPCRHCGQPLQQHTPRSYGAAYCYSTGLVTFEPAPSEPEKKKGVKQELPHMAEGRGVLYVGFDLFENPRNEAELDDVTLGLIPRLDPEQRQAIATVAAGRYPWRDIERLGEAIEQAEYERDAAIAAKEALAREHEGALAELHDAKLKLSTVATDVECVWLWQGDGHDQPESLSCSVVMLADTMRRIIAAKEAAERHLHRERKRCQFDYEQAEKARAERDRLSAELADEKVAAAAHLNAAISLGDTATRTAAELSAAVARAEAAETMAAQQESRGDKAVHEVLQLTAKVTNVRHVISAAWRLIGRLQKELENYIGEQEWEHTDEYLELVTALRALDASGENR